MELPAAVSTVASALEARIAKLSRRVAEHAERESALRREREQDEALLARLQATLANLQDGAAELAGAAPAAPAWDLADTLDLLKRYSVSGLVRLHVLDKPPGEMFGAGIVVSEIVRRFARHLRRPVTKALVSAALRRLAAAGTLEQVKKGNPHQDALYRRRVRTAPQPAESTAGVTSAT